MRDHGGRIAFRPRLPPEWSALRFPLAVRGRRLRVEIDHAVTTYRLIEGEAFDYHHDGEAIALTPDAPLASRPTPPPPDEEPRARAGGEGPLRARAHG